MFDLQVPATEIEIGEAIKASDPDTADTIRRLAYQRDGMITQVDQLKVENHQLQRELIRAQLDAAFAVVKFRRLQDELNKMIADANASATDSKPMSDNPMHCGTWQINL